MIRFAVLLLLLASLVARAGDEEAKPPRLFEDPALMEVTLTGPWRLIMRSKDNPRTHEGTLSYTAADGESRTIRADLTTRGKTRRDKVCDFPPLKLWFDKEENKGTEFRGQGSLKLVTYCQSKRSFEDLYVKEYLAYRIYNLITPLSHRVRPLMIRYLESGSDGGGITRFGFLIEDVDDVAKRNDMEKLALAGIKPSDLDPTESTNLALFQYLISNLDWAATAGPADEDCCHNARLIGPEQDRRPYFAIPYDFDSSGLVDAPYAVPPAQLKVRKTTQRLYRGFCLHNSEVPAALERFRAQHDAIIQLIVQESQLTSSSRDEAVRFVEGFYETLADPANVQELIIGKCRG